MVEKFTLKHTHTDHRCSSAKYLYISYFWPIIFLSLQLTGIIFHAQKWFHNMNNMIDTTVWLNPPIFHEKVHRGVRI